MVKVTKEGILLRKTDLKFENEAVLNPAAIQVGNFVHMFYRAVSNGNYSSIGYCRLSGPLTVVDRMTTPILSPEFEYESHGIEDPRIVKIDDLYYLSYTVYDGTNALGALALSNDLVTWKKIGPIVPQVTRSEFIHLAESNRPLNEKYIRYNEHRLPTQDPEKKILLWDKNIVFFPRMINDKIYFLHRIKPDIQITCVASLDELTPEFWRNYLTHINEYIFIAPKYEHEVSYLGSGCPPIETPEGWLIIYHGVHDSIKGYVYCACAALFDLQNPQIEIARLPYPLLKPELPWELKGEVNNVCFPTGSALFDDKLYIYYGAADEQIATASVSLKELLEELISNRK